MSTDNSDGHTQQFEKQVTVFCDASFCRKSGAVGWAVAVRASRTPGRAVRSQYLSGGTLSAEMRDNNAAELLAMEKASEHLAASVDLTGQTVVFYVDCLAALEAYRPDQLYRAGAASVELRHTPGHKGFSSPNAALNTWADKTAKSEMRVLRDEAYLQVL